MLVMPVLFELEVLVEVDVDVEDVVEAVPDDVELAVVLDAVLAAVLVAVADVLVVDAVVAVSVAEVLVEVAVDSVVEEVVVSRATTFLSSKALFSLPVVVRLHRCTARIASICASPASHPASFKHCSRVPELAPYCEIQFSTALISPQVTLADTDALPAMQAVSSVRSKGWAVAKLSSKTARAAAGELEK